MKIQKRTKESISKYLMYGAVAAILLASAGAIGSDIWLASTQWLLVALVLAAFGTYLRMV